MRRRLLGTTGQVGATKRLLQREGAWELIPGLPSLAETVEALAGVDPQEFQQEQARLRAHRDRFRLQTRSAKKLRGQLEKSSAAGKPYLRRRCQSEFCAIAQFGKSRLMERLCEVALEDRQRSLLVIDPHSTLVRQVAGRIPPARYAETLVWDLKQTGASLPLNLLALPGADESPGAAADEIVDTLRVQWADSWGGGWITT